MTAKVTKRHYNCGKDHYNYRDGRSLGSYFCILCAKQIYWRTWRYGSGKCNSCVQKGKSLSPEHRSKVVKTLASPFQVGHKTNAGKPTWNKGKQYSISEVARLRNANNPNYFRKGNEHPNWKGGITSLNKLVRQQVAYKTWKRIVIKRDKHRCVLCQSNNSVEAHHIVRLETLIEKLSIVSMEQAYATAALWDVGNGETRCYPCHNLTRVGQPQSS
ncbi:hypothetical protein LCGC14_2008220 [marine sediment metagenome]|uniref:Uncharacterized protein n=1 Tax=marine sediment metagenome TaxID=412755 RepID=A0A0F9F119_9ZZZZ